MKFKNSDDVQRFFLEIERFDLLGSDASCITKEMKEAFICKRRSLITPMKNFRRQQNSRQQWRHDRYKMMQGISSFHKSTKGKRFHRNLARFLGSRIAGNDEGLDDVSFEFLKALSSLKTHFWIEREYFHTVEEELDLLELEDELLPAIDRVEQALVSNERPQEDDMVLLVVLTGEQEMGEQECSPEARQRLFEALKRAGLDNRALPKAK